jgi:hypothetical protein
VVEQGAGPTSLPAEVPPGRFSRLTQATEAFPTAGDHLFFANREIDRVDVDDLRLDRCVFFNFGLKQATFRRGHLSHCFFERTYLRHASFKGVDLTGTIFIGCNLKYASFDGCRLDYVSFEECQLDYDNILQNLPTQPNTASPCTQNASDSRMLWSDRPSLGATATDRACVQAGLLGVGSQRLVRSRLPARTGRSVSGGNVAVNAQTNQLLRGTLLRSALASVPTNRFDRFSRQHLQRRSGSAKVLFGPFRILRVRTTGVLSHTFAPLAGWLAAS